MTKAAGLGYVDCSAPYTEITQYTKEAIMLASIEREEHNRIIQLTLASDKGEDLYSNLVGMCLPWLESEKSSTPDSVYAELMARYKAFKERVVADGAQTKQDGQ